MILLFSILSLLIMSSLGTTETLLKMTAIKFTVNDDNIEYYPDWSRLTTAFSACVWVKDLGSGYNTIFSYHTNELVMMANGYFTGIFSAYQHFNSGFPTKGTWFLACMTWSLSSREQRYYVNGKVIGSQQTPSGRSLRTGGKLKLGMWYASVFRFGGEMMYLNFYSKELTSSEIARMVQKGMCALVAEEDEHEASRVIKWEDLIQLERSGKATNTYEYANECLVNAINKQNEVIEELKDSRQELENIRLEKEEMEEKLSTKMNATLAELEVTREEKNEMETELEDVNTRLNSTISELEETQKNKHTMETELEDVNTRLNATISELEETQKNKEKVEQKLDEISSRLNSTLDELEEMSGSEYRTWDWNIFLSEEFLNRTFTTEDAQLLRSSWEDAAGKMVGVTMTKEVIELLNHITDKTNCGNGHSPDTSP
ncbi:uncharacterized protein LOC134824667 isoform X2 [Bolinopsis microptera]|uniref:uncharacterized protein LOC134824667 isoform X2 n=1 Tax=Bolinopsis microptera TaxID=2820187 RepID=UPI003079E937